MPYSTPSPGNILAQYYARHRRHSRYVHWPLEFLTKYNRPILARFTARRTCLLAEHYRKLSIQIGDYILGDENCIYLYGPEDIRY